MTGEELQALEHIDRNGDLMFMENSYRKTDMLFTKLIGSGLIEKNTWTGKWMVTKEGRRELSR